MSYLSPHVSLNYTYLKNLKIGLCDLFPVLLERYPWSMMLLIMGDMTCDADAMNIFFCSKQESFL